jgi:glycosyltransferase involved in cell wall biosynthesis
MMPVPRVLHVLATAHEHGASICRMVQTFAQGIDPQRYRIDAWFLGGDGPLAGELAGAGVAVRTFDWNARRDDISGALRFWRSLRREQFAIVHLHVGGRAVPFLIRATRNGKIVLHLHYNGAEAGSSGPIRVRPWMTDDVVALSEAVASTVVGVKPRVVYYGIKPRPASTGRCGSDHSIVVGAASRLVPIKGIVHLIRAVALLRPEFPDVRVEIAGSGPERGPLQQEVQALGLGDAVVFAGWQPDIWRWLAQVDIFVQPSLAEGFGMASLEAMAAGLPVLGTSVGGLPELIEHGRTGYVVRPAEPEALAARLRDLVQNADRRRTMGIAGQARAREHFSVERMTRSLTQIYDQLLGSDRTSDC